MNGFVQKVKRKAVRGRLQPIRVFCFHQVSDVFAPDTMNECDWIQSEVFKQTVLSMKEKTVFVSLKEAYHHIVNDKVRLRHYAVLTADDGWASIKNVLPWLSEQNLPITLFLNPGYFDGIHFREKNSERYLLEKDIKHISDTFPSVSFGIHGWEHVDVTKQNEKEFRENVEKSIQALKCYKSFIPFFAYPWGRRNGMSKRILKEHGLVPVLMDGLNNYNDASAIHRELLY